MITDWNELGKRIGAIHDDGSESGGDNYTQLALEEILGTDWIEHTVDHIIAFRRGQELAMNCLKYIHSKRAALYAYNIYKNTDGENAQHAVWLIKHLTHPISLDWIEEFLNDKNVMHWGIGILDQLLWTEIIPYNDKAKYLLEIAEAKLEGQLQEQVQFIREYLKERKQ